MGPFKIFFFLRLSLNPPQFWFKILNSFFFGFKGGEKIFLTKKDMPKKKKKNLGTKRPTKRKQLFPNPFAGGGDLAFSRLLTRLEEEGFLLFKNVFKGLGEKKIWKKNQAMRK